jgi:hypothetical protein
MNDNKKKELKKKGIKSTVSLNHNIAVKDISSLLKDPKSVDIMSNTLKEFNKTHNVNLGLYSAPNKISTSNKLLEISDNNDKDLETAFQNNGNLILTTKNNIESNINAEGTDNINAKYVATVDDKGDISIKQNVEETKEKDSKKEDETWTNWLSERKWWIFGIIIIISIIIAAVYYFYYKKNQNANNDEDFEENDSDSEIDS